MTAENRHCILTAINQFESETQRFTCCIGLHHNAGGLEEYSFLFENSTYQPSLLWWSSFVHWKVYKPTMSSSGCFVKKSFEFQLSSHESAKISQCFVQLVFNKSRGSSFTTWWNSRLSAIFLHNVSKWLGVLLEKANFVTFCLKLSSLQSSVNNLEFSCLKRPNQKYKDASLVGINFYIILAKLLCILHHYTKIPHKHIIHQKFSTQFSGTILKKATKRQKMDKKQSKFRNRTFENKTTTFFPDCCRRWKFYLDMQYLHGESSSLYNPYLND